jgi:hypothetical protein
MADAWFLYQNSVWAGERARGQAGRQAGKQKRRRRQQQHQHTRARARAQTSNQKDAETRKERVVGCVFTVKTSLD